MCAGLFADLLIILFPLSQNIYNCTIVAIAFFSFVYHAFFDFFSSLLLFLFPFHIILHNANNARDDPKVPSSRVGESSDAADAHATSDIRVADIEFDRRALSWSVPKNKTLSRIQLTLGGSVRSF